MSQKGKPENGIILLYYTEIDIPLTRLLFYINSVLNYSFSL
jgi:hypothetical protein